MPKGKPEEKREKQRRREEQEKANRNPAIAPPAVAPVIDAPKAIDSSPNQGTPGEQDGGKQETPMERYSRHQTVFAGALVLFTLAQVVVGYLQWDATDKQYNAMLESNTNTREASEMQLRPWLGIESIRAEWNDRGSSIELTIKIKNSGATPALAFEPYAEVYVDYEGVNRYVDTPDPEFFGTGLSGLGTTKDHVVSVPITQDEKAIFDSGDLRIIVEGCVEYGDAFESQHAFYFHFICVTTNGIPRITDESQIDDIVVGEEAAFDFLNTFHEMRRENKKAIEDAKREQKDRKIDGETSAAKE